MAAPSLSHSTHATATAKKQQVLYYMPLSTADLVFPEGMWTIVGHLLPQVIMI